MAIPHAFKPSPAPAGRSRGLVVLVFFVFFVISLLTNIIGPLIPDIIRSFRLSLTLAALLPFSFFIAYGVMSVPSGFLLERFREKPVMIAAFGMALFGSLLFSLVPRYPTAVVSLFSIGLGMAALQVAVNPLLRVAGGEEHFAANSVLAQLVFGGASFLSPHLYSYFVTNLESSSPARSLPVRLVSGLVPAGLPWVSVYWVFSVLVLVVLLVLATRRFPMVGKRPEERAGTWEVTKRLLREKMSSLYFLGIFAYVGLEQGTANWISQFLLTYHGYDPRTVGARAVSRFWGLMTIGCLLGFVLLKALDSRKVLIGFSAAAALFLSLGLFGPGPFALVAFPLVGFAASVMWSIIFSLALNSAEAHHGALSGILCTGIIGGAVVPLAVGGLGDLLGLRLGMVCLYLALGYILSIGFWARPLVANATLASRRRRSPP